MKQHLAIDHILKSRRVIINCGTGGVGKTTLSAALGIRSAMQQQNTIIVTIDPAHRLMEALGCTHKEQEADLTHLLEKIATEDRVGSLKAMTPNFSNTLEIFINKLTDNETLQKKIINNPLMEIFSKKFTGIYEYLALEKLLELSENKSFDTIILDTPPSKNMLVFLKTPEILLNFFNQPIVEWFLSSKESLFYSTSQKAMEYLHKFTGYEFIENMSQLAVDLFELKATLTQKLKKIETYLHSENVGFITVQSINSEYSSQKKDYDFNPIQETELFIKTLKEKKYTFEGCILNKSLQHLNFKSEKTSENLTILKKIKKNERQFIETCKENNINILGIVPALLRNPNSFEDICYVANAFI